MRLALAGALIIAGCSGPTTPTPTPAIEPPKPAPVATRTTRFEGDSTAYLDAVQEFDHLVIVYHPGGYIHIQKQALQIHHDTGKTAHVEGNCISACGLLFSIGDQFTWRCSSRHGFQSAWAHNAAGDRILNRGATLDAMTYYPPALALELGERGMMDQISVSYFSGQQITDITDIPCRTGP